MIPVEIGEPSLRRQIYDDNAIRNMAAKQRAVRKYNSKLQPRVFVKGDLVWKMISTARKKDNKFSAN